MATLYTHRQERERTTWTTELCNGHTKCIHELFSLCRRWGLEWRLCLYSIITLSHTHTHSLAVAHTHTRTLTHGGVKQCALIKHSHYTQEEIPAGAVYQSLVHFLLLLLFLLLVHIPLSLSGIIYLRNQKLNLSGGWLVVVIVYPGRGAGPFWPLDSCKRNASCSQVSLFSFIWDQAPLTLSGVGRTSLQVHHFINHAGHNEKPANTWMWQHQIFIAPHLFRFAPLNAAAI